MMKKMALAVSYHPEAELLLCCARTHIDPEKARQIKALLRGTDWEYLIQMAEPHRLLPLLYHNLSITCPERVPKAILERLRNQFCENVVRNLFQTDELVNLLNLLEKHEICAIPFKGPILAKSAYNNLSLRQFGDLDILLRKQDILKAKDLLTACGYQIELTGSQQEYFLKHRYHYHFRREDGVVNVELHWAFTRRYWPFQLDFDHLRERSGLVLLAGTKVPNFSPEDSLLVLCAHGAKHSWPRLLWICDVAELIRAHPEMDWSYVIRQAEKLGSKRILLLGLYLTNNLLGAVLPKGIEQTVQADRTVKPLAAKIRGRLFLEEPSCFRGVEAHIFYCKLRERLRDRVPYLLHHLFSYLSEAITPNERDRALLPLPGFLFFLYYLLRPLRLVRTYGVKKVK